MHAKQSNNNAATRELHNTRPKGRLCSSAVISGYARAYTKVGQLTSYTSKTTPIV